ncbi:MAG: hypothetical protein LBB48_03205 [Treponema sp.]|jgi:hypothetical protein|nr:hypothetical protein [Treponema sp.]
MKVKQAVIGEYKTHYQMAAKKVKSAILDDFTRLTGCRRKSPYEAADEVLVQYVSFTPTVAGVASAGWNYVPSSITPIPGLSRPSRTSERSFPSRF